ncbi:MAG TPA: SMP-30/gluconolactonase/LRE family protein [Solirubrobacterales bacterium]|jgi:sugar lactone lactonase YvrE|nr:SMP-30/gluconolactonase/LRE family protein [Solirubrobacterales bacterium]
MSATEVVADGLVFAEGLRWHEGALWFSDMHGRCVYRLEIGGEPEVIATIDDRPSGLGFLADGRPLVVSMVDRRLLAIEDGGLAEYADLSSLAPWHCNDMHVDPQGRAYVGNFGDGAEYPDVPGPTVLILVEADGTARVVAEDLCYPNGIDLTADGGTLIVAETCAAPGRLTAFAVAADGSLSDRRTLVSFAGPGFPDARDGGGSPDGIAIDAEGGIWVAFPLGDEVLQVTPDGQIDRRVAVDNPFSVALGGADRRDLFICTAPSWLPDEALANRAGSIRRLRVDVPGQLAN